MKPRRLRPLCKRKALHVAREEFRALMDDGQPAQPAARMVSMERAIRAWMLRDLVAPDE